MTSHIALILKLSFCTEDTSKTEEGGKEVEKGKEGKKDAETEQHSKKTDDEVSDPASRSVYFLFPVKF